MASRASSARASQPGAEAVWALQDERADLPLEPVAGADGPVHRRAEGQARPLPAAGRGRRRRSGNGTIPIAYGPVLGQTGRIPAGRRHASPDVAGAGRRADHPRGRRGRALRGLGAECRAGLGGRRFQHLGRPAPCDAPPRRRPGSGRSSCPAWAKARSTNTKSAPMAARSCRSRPIRSASARNIRPATGSVVRRIDRADWQRRAAG